MSFFDILKKQKPNAYKDTKLTPTELESEAIYNLEKTLTNGVAGSTDFEDVSWAIAQQKAIEDYGFGIGNTVDSEELELYPNSSYDYYGDIYPIYPVVDSELEINNPESSKSVLLEHYAEWSGWYLKDDDTAVPIGELDGLIDSTLSSTTFLPDLTDFFRRGFDITETTLESYDSSNVTVLIKREEILDFEKNISEIATAFLDKREDEAADKFVSFFSLDVEEFSSFSINDISGIVEELQDLALCIKNLNLESKIWDVVFSYTYLESIYE